VLLEIDWGINELCSQWVSCIPGTTTQDCFGTAPEPATRKTGGGLICMPILE